MKRLLLLLTVALAATAGTARAGEPPQMFSIIPSSQPSQLSQLPGSNVPNMPGAIALPASFTTAPLQSEQLSQAQLEALWQRAGAAYGIDWHVLAAINEVESNFGRNMGPSSAGAIGWMQFMPSTWLRWGVDANGDGVADPWNAEDAVFAAARYLAAAGGGTDIAGAVFAYNHAQWYVDEVLRLANLYAAGGADVTFTLDRLQQSLDEAQSDLVAANRLLVPAQRRARVLSRREDRLLARVTEAHLLSDRLAAQKAAALLDVRLQDARATLERLQAGLAAAQTSLRAARARAQTAAFAPGAGTVLAAPSYSGTYVFPVGGGASVVSTSHTHHDYPAADIAAPEGSPEYALSDAVVLDAWRVPEVRCGIGMTIRTSDGQSWTYCHLSYLEPAVQKGATLTAGQPVGLVGHTGDATGPHLHLQLNPATSYPQEEGWFQGFAGTAFRWQDNESTRTLASAPAAPMVSLVPAAQADVSTPVTNFTPVIAFTRVGG